MPTRARTFATALMMFCGCASHMVSPPPIRSGLQPGDDIIPSNPIHVTGPNAGTNACPVCTYEARPAIQVFTRDGPNAAALSIKLQILVQQQAAQQLKGFVIVLDSTPDKIKKLATDSNLRDIGLCYPDPQTREHDLKAYKINPFADNTIVVYRNYKVTSIFVNLKASDFSKVENAVTTH